MKKSAIKDVLKAATSQSWVQSIENSLGYQEHLSRYCIFKQFSQSPKLDKEQKQTYQNSILNKQRLQGFQSGALDKNARPSKLFASRDISGQVAFITGAASGIGECTALGFAEQGCKLILLDISQERLEKLKILIQEQFPVDIHLTSVDVTDLDQVTSSIENLPQDFKQVDILCNNVGVGTGLGPVHEYDIGQVYKMIDINVKALFAITRLITPQMVARNAGQVINLASTASHSYYPDFSAYCASKHAVKAFTLCMQHDFLKNRVKCTNISPGYVTGSRFFDDLKQEVREARSQVANDITNFLPSEKLQGCVTVSQVADTILYAATRPENVNITEIQIQHVYEAGTCHGLKEKNP